MRTFLLILIFVFSKQLFSQTIFSGRISGNNAKSWSKLSRVMLVVADTLVDNNISVIDSGMAFALVVPDIDTVSFAVDYQSCGLFVFRNISVKKNTINNIGVLKVDLEKRSDKCPLNSNDKVIPVIYGQPSKGLQKKIDKGEIYDAGCIIFCSEKQYYCTRHKLTF